MNKLQVLIVDDHKIVRDGVKLYLEKLDFLEVIAEAADGAEAIKLVHKLNPDIVFIDINMEKLNGIEATKKIVEAIPDQKIIALTMHNDYQHIKAMMDAGARGYLLKNCDENEMKSAIEAVMDDEIFYSQEVAQTVMNNMAKKKPKNQGFSTPLTPREMEVYRLILQEKSNQEIADLLFISVRTVEVHKRNLMEKTGAKNSTGLVLYAVKNDLFDEI